MTTHKAVRKDLSTNCCPMISLFVASNRMIFFKNVKISSLHIDILARLHNLELLGKYNDLIRFS